MFIVKKEVSGKNYYYLRKSRRIKGKVKAITLAYLGRTRKEAEENLEKFKNIQEKDKTLTNKKEKVKKIKKMKPLTIDELAVFCKRKGFVYASAEIYGGLSGFWDFGNLGASLKNNIKESWKDFFIRKRKDIAFIDGSIITNPRVWEASGHVESFKDISVTCKKCKKQNKIDKSELEKAVCEFCGGELEKEKAENLNLMFTTQVGPTEKNSVKAYLRPETAQLIFADFRQVAENSRLKLPFGIAQTGKAFRNEIAPRDFLFRAREFEQMEIEYFILPESKCPYKIPDIKISVFSAEMKEKGEEMEISDALRKGIIKKDWHAYWLSQCLLWFKSLGCNMDNFRIRQHGKDELAHYSTDCWDLEYRFPFGWKELTGIADRGNYDLSRHKEFSGKDMEIFVEGKGKVLPNVVAEPSFGVERAFLVLMLEAYYYDSKRENIVLKLHPKISPVKAAILPIVKKSGFIRLAEKICDDLNDFNIAYDESGSIGRRYSRQDEAGTPLCITIDGDSIKDKSVTIRDRDTTEQIRVKTSNLKEVVRKVMEGESLVKLGKVVKTRVK